jgi:large subunit ribosomal protein L17
MAMIELVDFNEVYTKEKATAGAAAKRTRRGRTAKPAATKAAAESKATEAAAPAEGEAKSE